MLEHKALKVQLVVRRVCKVMRDPQEHKENLELVLKAFKVMLVHQVPKVFKVLLELEHKVSKEHKVFKVLLELEHKVSKALKVFREPLVLKEK